MKILVAEDDDVSRLVLVTRLQKLGHSVLEHADGASAWKAFLAEHPRVVVTDWMMPKVDGLELCRRIRDAATGQYTYIITLTALSGKRSLLEAMNAGADDFITKPVETDELIARLRVAERIIALQSEVRQLEGLLPICGYCKKIRDEKNAWEQIEGYISKRSAVEFSHGVCPDCYDRIVKPELDALKQGRTS